MAARPGKNVPVCQPTDLPVAGEPELQRVKVDRMVLVKRLTIEDRLSGRAVVVFLDALPTAAVAVAGLVHIEVEPIIVVEPLGGGSSACRMERHQMPSAVSFF